jgi:long-chain fatty acid transport protein
MLKNVAILVLMLSVACFATNGYFSHGYGTQNKSMAGVGVALPLNTLSAATNPAGMVFVGQRYDVSLALFNPNREYTITGTPSGLGFGLAPGTIESDSKTFFVPAVGGNWMIDEMSSVGVSIYGNGGMNTDYDTKTFDSPLATVTAPTGVNLSQLFLGATYARKLSENHALGLTAIFSYQMFSAEGLQAFAGLSTDATKVSNNDTDNGTGFGFRVGYLGELTDGFFVGGSYQSKISMSEFSDYAGLFAEAGDFDIPASWTAGLAYELTPEFTVAADVQQILYSGIKSINNPLDPASLNPMMNPNGFIPLGSDDAAGFGWEDVTVYKVGMQYHALPEWIFRAGFSVSEQPIPETEMLFNILAPGVVEQHITFGFSKLFGDYELSLSVMHAFSNSISGANTLEVPGAQTIELAMDQWEVEVGFGF